MSQKKCKTSSEIKMKRLKLLLPILLFSTIINSQNWGEQIIEQPVKGTSHRFGTSVSIDGNYAVVGAPGENDLTGAANIFKKDEIGKLGYLNKQILDKFEIDHSVLILDINLSM